MTSIDHRIQHTSKIENLHSRNTIPISVVINIQSFGNRVKIFSNRHRRCPWFVGTVNIIPEIRRRLVIDSLSLLPSILLQLYFVSQSIIAIIICNSVFVSNTISTIIFLFVFFISSWVRAQIFVVTIEPRLRTIDKRHELIRPNAMATVWPH
jgi:hypothetical protein